MFHLQVPTICVNEKHDIRRQLGNVIKRIPILCIYLHTGNFRSEVNGSTVPWCTDISYCRYTSIFTCCTCTNGVRGDFVFDFRPSRKL